jgi:antitoxin PrlF
MAAKSNKNYSISPAKIGNQDGFRLPRAFSKDYPHLVAASGYLEVLDDNTLLVRLEPTLTSEGNDEIDESLTMSLFLDTLMKEVIKEPSSVVPYTEEMSEEISELLSDVTIDETDNM